MPVKRFDHFLSDFLPECSIIPQFPSLLKLRIGFRRQKEKVLCLLIGQLHLNVRRNADICKAFAFGRKYSSTDRLTAEPSLSW